MQYLEVHLGPMGMEQLLTVLIFTKTWALSWTANLIKFHLHTTEVTVKAKQLLGLIRKSLDSDMLTTAFVCPTLEYK